MFTNTYRIIQSILALSMMCSCISSSKAQTDKNIQINYLDEYVFYNDSIFTDSKIGGLSGIEYNKEQDSYYVVCDDANNPRFYKATITINNKRFDTVIMDQLIKIKDSQNHFFNNNILDLEDIRMYKKDKFIFASEGSIKNNYNPAIFITDTLGTYYDHFQLPSYFKVNPTSKNKPRHNGVFEGLAPDIDNKGYWAAMELPLKLDGKEPTIDNSGAPIRITHFDATTAKADFQFTYPLDKLAKDPRGKFGVNGVTGLLQLNRNQFLIVERGYAAGYGTQGNTIRIYLCTMKNATNTLSLDSLQNKKYKSASKRLLFDFESIRNHLTDQIVDNIEGITFGPILENGNQSLLLISDNNFNPISEQINQLILLELSNNK
ncbi:esterase-like activity of phytase family protein [Aquimarina sp. SS2-1]|uniref:esterase-like activity of phytase family protein n=1 Tax=Aquimarina besae TaxID=3342247 RepID=UPI00366E8124